MGSIAGVERNGEDRVEGGGSLLEETAEPILYQLVRVDGDGRLVPATDDELMTVEELLGDEKHEFGRVTDSEQTMEYNGTELCSSKKMQLDEPQGHSASEKHEAVVTDNLSHQMLPDSDKLNTQGDATAHPLTSEYIHIDNFDRTDGCSNSSDASANNMSASTSGASSMPDFSKLKGEIHLENLTVKELQETFKATFGRATSVKDKSWLMRRISMGLSNSCDFSCTHFVIEDNGVVKKVKEESIADVRNLIGEDLIVALANTNSAGHEEKAEVPGNTTEGNIPKSPFEGCNVREELNSEERAAKRVRKPTKRYIEEISEVELRESSGKSMPSEKSCAYESTHPHNLVISILKARPDGEPLVMRKDLVGGSGVQIPCVSRIRRGRPRENYMTLLNDQPNGTSMEPELVKEPLNASNPEIDKTDKVTSSTSEKGEHFAERKIIEEEIVSKHENKDTHEDDHSDDNMMTEMAAPAVGMRRKHHRPWTLDEDKWRNLLKASFVQLPGENGTQNNASRKHATIMIPAPILLRVRELAEMNGHISPRPNQSKCRGGRIVDAEKVGCM
ncbi:hypothetical protein DM860_014353 [Cuscuta australis]|uniref:Uncharacterized protein n=1 Tax=Cuscuta australis TaxID=267555 RepID=A0A328DD95_9ASTE|nr:hypothetical protein DM860_014353 [Cuscuta australis]